MAIRRRKSGGYTNAVAAFLVFLLGVGQAYNSSDNNNNNNNAAQPLPPKLPRQLGDNSDVRTPLSDVIGRQLTSDNETRSASNFPIPDLSSYSKGQLYTLLVDVLQQLSVLQRSDAACHVLQKIQVVNDDKKSQPSLSTVGVHLYFTESPLTTQHSNTFTSYAVDSARQDVNSATNSKAANSQSNSQTAQANSQSVRTSVGDSKLDNTRLRSETPPECVSTPVIALSMDAQPLLRDGVLNDTLGRRVEPSPTQGANETLGLGPGRHTGNSGGFEYNESADATVDKDKFGGLSRTQVVVISSCSAIIALFFLVAGILRIRNYIKRVREEQMMAQRPTFRSCSVRLRSVSQSNDPVRRDSQVSKLSHQSNYNGRNQGYSLTNGSTSRDHSNASSPSHDPDTKPLLVVTAVTEGRSPSVSQSSSLQFIDEEPRKKTETAAPGLDGGDEYKPLLGSDTSGSTLLVSPTSPTSGHQRGQLNGHPNGQANWHQNGHSNGRLPSGRQQTTLVTDDGMETHFQRVSDTPSPKSDRAGVLETSFGDPAHTVRPEQHVQQGDAGQKGANGLGENVQHNPKSDAVVQVPLIRFCGLTQSDSSLSSQDGNRNYGHGTQSEYTPPYLGYLASGQVINGVNSPYTLAFIANPNGVYGVTSGNSSPQNTAPKDRPSSLDGTRLTGTMKISDLASDKSYLQERLASFDSGVEVPLTLPASAAPQHPSQTMLPDAEKHSVETDHTQGQRTDNTQGQRTDHTQGQSCRGEGEQSERERGTPNTPPSMASSPTHGGHSQRRPVRAQDSFALSSSTPFTDQRQDSFDCRQGSFDSRQGSVDNRQGSFDNRPGSFDHRQGSFEQEANVGHNPRKRVEPRDSFSIFSPSPSHQHTHYFPDQRQSSCDHQQGSADVRPGSTGSVEQNSFPEEAPDCGIHVNTVNRQSTSSADCTSLERGTSSQCKGDVASSKCKGDVASSPPVHNASSHLPSETTGPRQPGGSNDPLVSAVNPLVHAVTDTVSSTGGSKHKEVKATPPRSAIESDGSVSSPSIVVGTACVHVLAELGQMSGPPPPLPPGLDTTSDTSHHSSRAGAASPINPDPQPPVFPGSSPDRDASDGADVKPIMLWSGDRGSGSDVSFPVHGPVHPDPVLKAILSVDDERTTFL